jgi:hypothetical protein
LNDTTDYDDDDFDEDDLDEAYREMLRRRRGSPTASDGNQGGLGMDCRKSCRNSTYLPN